MSHDRMDHHCLSRGRAAGGRLLCILAFQTRQHPRRRLARVIRIEIISEASRRLPDELKARYPSIAWKEMAGAGNIYPRDYKDVAASYVWVTVQNHLPPLRAGLKASLPPSALDGQTTRAKLTPGDPIPRLRNCDAFSMVKPSVRAVPS
jgi:uncharacterized protein with HEPN domain